MPKLEEKPSTFERIQKMKPEELEQRGTDLYQKCTGEPKRLSPDEQQELKACARIYLDSTRVFLPVGKNTTFWM